MANPPVDPTWDHESGVDSDNATPVATVGTITAAKVRSLYADGEKATRGAERQYWINRAYLADEQWVYWNPSTRTLGVLQPDPDRVRITIDRLKPGTRRLMAKLLRRPLVFNVPAGAADDGTVTGARIAEGVLRHVHDEHSWEKLREEHALVTWKSGTGVLSVDWDPSAGEPLGHDPITGKAFGTGDFVESVLSLGEVVTEPGARDIERARWWIKCVALPPEQVRDMYKLPRTPPSDATGAMSGLQRQLVSGGDTQTDVSISLTKVLTYYERPSNLGPGQVCTVVNGEYVDGGPKPWPFPFKERLNLVCAVETMIENTWYGQTILSAAISPQTAFNQSWSSVVEHMKKVGNARILKPSQTGELRLSDEPGEVVEYDAGTGIPAPAYMSPPQMPAWWIEEPDRLKAEIDDILGDHDVSRGNAADSGASSGVAISLLIEQDDTPIGRLAKELAEAWGRFATMCLKIYEQRVTADGASRKAIVASPGRPPEQIAWTGKSLAGQTRAEVPLEQVQPRSRAAQLQLATMLKQQYPDMPFQVFASIADLPGQDNLIEGVDADLARARWENHMMSIDVVQIPEQFDDHRKHIEEHNRLRKSVRYGQSSDQTRRMIDDHVQAHEVLAAEQAGEMLDRAQVHPALAAAAQAGAPEALDASQQSPQAALAAAASAAQQQDQSGPQGSVPGGAGQAPALPPGMPPSGPAV